MKNTILMATVLAVATVLAAGLTVLPSSVQEAQANPCSNEAAAEANGGDGDTAAAGGDIVPNVDQRECTFIGNIDID
jgi:hypothetical protein